MDTGTYLAHLERDTDRFAAAVASDRLDAAVAACPGWHLRELAVHLGHVHRWATAAIEHGVRPPFGGDEPADADLAAWLRAGGTSLIGAVAGADPQASTWHPFPFEQRVWVWARRQAHETAVHRWDAEVAAQGTSSLDAVLAADGIHEYVEMALPRVLSREQVVSPSATLGIRCTDVAGTWALWTDGAAYRTAPGDRATDAELRGPAESLLLVLMGRARRSAIDIGGDAAVADAWLSLPGL